MSLFAFTVLSSSLANSLFQLSILSASCGFITEGQGGSKTELCAQELSDRSTVTEHPDFKRSDVVGHRS